jgi:hypothetical protein
MVTPMAGEPKGCLGIMEIVADNVRAGATTFAGFVSTVIQVVRNQTNVNQKS